MHTRAFLANKHTGIITASIIPQSTMHTSLSRTTSTTLSSRNHWHLKTRNSLPSGNQRHQRSRPLRLRRSLMLCSPLLAPHRRAHTGWCAPRVTCSGAPQGVWRKAAHITGVTLLTVSLAVSLGEPLV
jgi:hypothetical protein